MPTESNNKGREDRQPPLRPPMIGANLGSVGPLASYEEVDHVWRLLRQLSSLLEGSMTTLGKAKTSLSGETVLDAATTGEAEKQLKGAAAGLERMSELVHAAMQGPNVPIGSAQLSRARPVRLGEAVEHAVELLGNMARERGVALAVEMAPGIADLPAGAMYTVVLNGLQNAVEAVSRRGGRGRVEIHLRHDRAPAGGYGRDAREWYVLEIRDDGVGIPAGRDASRVFDLGFTTKPRGAGVGLAVAKSVVQGMGGTIELTPRAGGGAVLRVRFPGATAAQLKFGGAA
jgi:signal transduction histidine kinase